MARKSNPATKAVEEQRKRTEDANRETEERMANSRPTPTQEENDLAKVGALDIDNKEEDGSEDEVTMRRRVMEGNLSTPMGSYSTRAATPAASDSDTSGGKSKK